MKKVKTEMHWDGRELTFVKCLLGAGTACQLINPVRSLSSLSSHWPGETQSQKGCITCPRSQSYHLEESGFAPRFGDSGDHTLSVAWGWGNSLSVFLGEWWVDWLECGVLCRKEAEMRLKMENGASWCGCLSEVEGRSLLVLTGVWCCSGSALVICC